MNHEEKLQQLSAVLPWEPYIVINVLVVLWLMSIDFEVPWNQLIIWRDDINDLDMLRSIDPAADSLVW